MVCYRLKWSEPVRVAPFEISRLRQRSNPDFRAWPAVQPSCSSSEPI
jgi:hypothetical protein